MNGWESRCAVAVIEPELEAWVWDESLQIAGMLGWERQRLRDWLAQNDFLTSATAAKPGTAQRGISGCDACREAAIVFVKFFQDLAEAANVTGCTDAAFGKLSLTLRSWFPPSNQ